MISYICRNLKRIKKMLYHLITKLEAILSTIYGWIAAGVILAFNLLCDYVAGHESSIFIVLFVVVLDAIWGIARAVKSAAYTTSELMRESFFKLAVYSSVILCFIGFDKIGGWSDTGVTVPIISCFIILIEVYSIAANILIVYPDFPFINLFYKYLSGEIASKLNLDRQDLEEYIKKVNKKTKKDNKNETTTGKNRQCK